jgi:hypothetical protein
LARSLAEQLEFEAAYAAYFARGGKVRYFPPWTKDGQRGE